MCSGHEVLSLAVVAVAVAVEDAPCCIIFFFLLLFSRRANATIADKAGKAHRRSLTVKDERNIRRDTTELSSLCIPSFSNTNTATWGASQKGRRLAGGGMYHEKKRKEDKRKRKEKKAM